MYIVRTYTYCCHLNHSDFLHVAGLLDLRHKILPLLGRRKAARLACFSRSNLVWKPDLMNFLLWSWPEVLNFTLWKLGHFSLAWSELCVFQNIRTKKAKETSLYNPGSRKILQKWHQDLKTRRIDFTTDLTHIIYLQWHIRAQRKAVQ